MSDRRETGSQAEDEATTPGSNAGDQGDSVEAGILSQLPRTRPQRASRRRVRSERPKAPAAAEAATPDQRQQTDRPRRKASEQARAKAAEQARSKAAARSAPLGSPQREAVPRQGFEPEEDLGSDPISPPSGLELTESLFELTGELARAGRAGLTSLAGIAKSALRRNARP